MAGDIVSNKSFKFNNNMYLDSTGIVHSREKLDEIISNLQSKIDTLEKAQYFQIGETYEIKTDTVYASFVTTSVTQMSVAVVFPKLLDKISNITVNSLQGRARGVNGYVDDSSRWVG